MKLFSRLLSLLLCLAVLWPASVMAQETPGFRLVDPVTETTDARVSIVFEGEIGVSYTLHYKFRKVWLLPTTLELRDSTQGSFDVELGPGENDFVLVESTQPRDSQSGIAFSIYRITDATPAVTPAPTELPTPDPTPVPEETTPMPTAQEGEPAPTDAPIDATPELTLETTVPEPTDAPDTTTPEPVEATPEPTPLPTPTPVPTPTPIPEPTHRTLTLWAEGEDVTALQEGLQSLGFKFGRVDGVYGPRTRNAVRRFQRKYALQIDGVVGARTREKLVELGVELPLYSPPDMTMPDGFERTMNMGTQGMDVFWLQEALIEAGYLTRSPDQVYGKYTRDAVRAFQADHGLKADGKAGPDTLRALFGMDDAETGDAQTTQPTATIEPASEPFVTIPPEPLPDVTPLPATGEDAPEETETEPNG